MLLVPRQTVGVRGSDQVRVVVGGPVVVDATAAVRVSRGCAAAYVGVTRNNIVH